MELVGAVPPGVETGPFHARQEALGATFYEDLGWLWTASFGDPVAEYWAVRRDVALWDVSALVKWRFTGPGSRAALDAITTRRVEELEPGTVRYGLVLDERGRMLDEGTVLIVSDVEAWFLGNDEREPFEEHLRRNAHGHDVRIENMTSRVANVSIQGPRSFDLLSRLTDVDLASLRWFQAFPVAVEVAGVRGLLSRTGFSGELGYEFFLEEGETARAERLWDAISEAGASPIGLDAVELLRVEAGLLVQHEDYWPGETDPYELSLEPAIDLDHGFVGKDVCLATLAAPPRRFVTLVFDADVEPSAAGERVFLEGLDVGDLRSPARSPRFGPIALAVVTADAAAQGSDVEAGGRRASVRPVPIDDPRKTRPRSDPRHPITIGDPA